MYSSTSKTLKLFNAIQPSLRKTVIRTLLNPFASKPIEKASDSHSNLLADTENVFELQTHTIKPNAMVGKKKIYFLLLMIIATCCLLFRKRFS